MVADLPNTSNVALLVMLLSTCSQMLLSQRHLLLHVADLLLGPAAVLLEEQPDKEDTEKHQRCVSVITADECLQTMGTSNDQKYLDTLHLYVIVKHLIPKPPALICCYNRLRSSKVWLKILEPGCRDLHTSATKALLMLTNEVGRYSHSLQFIPKSIPVKFFHSKLGKSFLYGRLHEGIVMQKQERTSNNCHYTRSTLLSKTVVPNQGVCVYVLEPLV